MRIRETERCRAKEVQVYTAARNPRAPNPTRQDRAVATHIIHTPAAMFRGWMVIQLKRPEMAQAGKQETRAGISRAEGTGLPGRPPGETVCETVRSPPHTQRLARLFSQHLGVSPPPSETSEANTAALRHRGGRWPQGPSAREQRALRAGSHSEPSEAARASHPLYSGAWGSPSSEPTSQGGSNERETSLKGSGQGRRPVHRAGHITRLGTWKM